jgi:Na+/H+ antiporter NhaC
LSQDPLWHQNPIFSCTIGSVLAGSIFGDHCSPLSDTTVLSSQSCGCELAAHVWTQFPYALVVAFVAILFGTLPIGFGFLGATVQFLLPIGSLVLIVFLYFFGKPTP